MLTIFSIPKPFAGHDGIIQSNALQSWARLGRGCEIVLCGDDPGVGEAAREFGVRHAPAIDRNEYGTPLLSSAFEQVRRTAAHEMLCYVNADIMLLSDLLDAVRRLPFHDFLMAGRRWDFDLQRPWDFERADWETHLRQAIAERGVRHSPLGMDYFVFPRRHPVGQLKPFAVGRPGWDNWLIYRARAMRLPVVDASDAVTAVHQNHGYQHVSGGRNQCSEGPEGDRNLALAGGWNHIFTLWDATHVLTADGIRRALDIPHLRRRWQALGVLVPRTRLVVSFVSRVTGRLRRCWS
ncbi:MAG: hypothetical protein AB1515_00990 [Nitrospirota bacterium]